MKKVVKYDESGLERLVEKILKEQKINEDLPRRERERHATQFAKSKFEPYDRERHIMNAFGPYRDDVPANVVSYLRKNPRTFLRKLTDVYGMDKMLDFIGYTAEVDEVPADMEMVEGYDSYMEDTWPKDLKKGRFTSYCKREGFSGPSRSCANHAMDSDDASVRGMASFYLNTVKP